MKLRYILDENDIKQAIACWVELHNPSKKEDVSHVILSASIYEGDRNEGKVTTIKAEVVK